MLFVAMFFVGMVEAQAVDVMVYSARKERLLLPLLQAYKLETGVEVSYLTDAAEPLLSRLKTEGAATEADILLTVDAGHLWHAAQLGVLAAVDSKRLQHNIPENLRDPNHRWYGLSVRARTMVYNREWVNPGDLSTYEDLADPKWKGHLCLRTSEKIYNKSMVAMMIAQHGEAVIEPIIKGWVANLAQPVFSSDTKLLDAIEAGKCNVGIVNTYYFGRSIRGNPGSSLALFWANRVSGGTHINISGAGITKHAKHPASALKLLEWFSTENAQKLFAKLNMEYPANPRVKPDAMLASWGNFKQEAHNVSLAGEFQADAVKLMKRAGYR